jgi:hypothetical protein
VDATGRWQGRKTGDCAGSWHARISEINPLKPADVPQPERRAPLHWAILEVEEPKFQDAPCLHGFGVPADGARLSMGGYPGGSVTWKRGKVLQNLLSDDVRRTLQGDVGTIKPDPS